MPRHPMILWVILCALTGALAPPLTAQNFAAPTIWTSEDFTEQNHGGTYDWFQYDNHGRGFAVGNNYENMLYALPGNYNGDFALHKPELAMLFDVAGNLAVFTLESQGYRPLDITKLYETPTEVNQQEGTLLDTLPGHAPYLYHATYLRLDSSISAIPVQQIKKAVVGDFDGNGRDEIALFIQRPTVSTQRILILQAPYGGDTLNYTFTVTTAMTVLTSDMDFSRIRFATAGTYGPNWSGARIAVLYDDTFGAQQIYTFDPGTTWTKTLRYSGTTSTLDFSKVTHVASGTFDGDDSTRVAICYDGGSTQKIFVTTAGSGTWQTLQRFSQPSSTFDFKNVRGVVAGQFDNSGSDDELAIFYDYGNLDTGIQSVQKVFVTDHASTSWGYRAVINEKRSGMDFDRIFHCFAANLDYNTGTRRDELGVVYNDQADRPDGQEFNDDKVIVYTNKPDFTDNDMAFNVDGQPFFPLGWGGVFRDHLSSFRQRAGGYYNTVWMANLYPDRIVPPARVPGWLHDYEYEAEQQGLKVVPEFSMAALLHNDTASYVDILDSTYFPPVIGWATADEPDYHGYDRNAVMFLSGLVKSYAPDCVVMPVMAGPAGGSFYHNGLDAVWYDGYPYNDGTGGVGPFLRAPVHAGILSSFSARRAVENAVRYGKQSVVFSPQGTNGGGNRVPGFDEMRYNTFAPVIEGARGILYWTYAHSTDTVRNRADLVADELGHYTRIFLTPSEPQRVSTTRNRFVPSDFDQTKVAGNATGVPPMRVDYKGGFSRYMNLLTYDLHFDPRDSIYYLFVSNNWSLPVEGVELTVFGVPNDVSWLHPEYFKNGHYTPVTAWADAAGGYMSFVDSYEPNQVKVYAIGGRPAPDATFRPFTGSLAFSNQRKLIAAPKTSLDTVTGQLKYSDTVYYHLTYHRYDSASHRTKVYYRRSKPTLRNLPAETAEWEPWELALSDKINPFWWDDDTLSTCAHPSIVVRYDTATRMNQVYVVFNCESKPTDPGGYIVESMLEADATYSYPPSLPLAYTVATYAGRSVDEWGTPMVNASVNGNYYVWADSLNGIMAGWKKPNEAYFRDTLAFSWNTLPTRAQHPSVNSYSRIADAENNCAVVWQEPVSSNPSATTGILYTRLRADSVGQLGIYLSPAFCSSRDTLRANGSRTIGVVADDKPWGVHRMPSVFRSVEEDTMITPLRRTTLLDMDRISWESVPMYATFCLDGQLTGGTRIGYRAIDLIDTGRNRPWQPECMTASLPRYIWSSSSHLRQPSMAQGSFHRLGSSLTNSDSAVVLTFNSSKACPTWATETNIWHVPHGYYSFQAAPKGGLMEMADLTTARKVPGPASWPQLAAQPSVRSPLNWYNNHRVFISGTTSAITAERRYYVKPAVTEAPACPLAGFMRDSLFCLFTPFAIDGSFVPPDVRRGDTSGIVPPWYGDTLRTGWFPLGASQRLDFAVFGVNTHGGIAGSVEKTQLWLECRSTGAMTQLTLPQGNNDYAVPLAFTLINGNDDDYRLVVINKDNGAGYAEQLVLDGLPTSSTTVFGGTIGKPAPDAEHLIDLSALRGAVVPGYAAVSAYPNPTHDKFRVLLPSPSGGGSRDIRLSVISPVGVVVAEMPATAGRQIEVPTEGWASGSYLIRVYDGATIIAQGRIIVER